MDIDAVGHAHLAAAIERFGEPRILIETAFGKWKGWYRHNSEARRIRPVSGLPVDVLGDGCTIAPPSFREDRGASYRFVKGALDNLDRLSAIKANALEAPSLYRPAVEIFQGERNNWLLHRCMFEARHCDDPDALLDCARTIASPMPEPLSAADVERAARSAWRYERGGLNFVGLKRQQVMQRDAIMNEQGDQTDAYYLLDLFRRWHGEKEFSIAPRAMLEAGNPPWHWTRIDRARNVLRERHFLEAVSPPDRGRHKAGRYRLTGKCTESVHNHLTPLPACGWQHDRDPK